jgi:hypothetical protein
MSAAAKQSRKVREFLAKKQEEEAAKHATLLSIIENPTRNNNANENALKCFYDITIDKCKGLLVSSDTKEIFKAINILRKLIETGHDIDYVIVRLLCYGSLLFFQFVKQVRRDLLNHFEAYDEVVHACTPREIIELLKFGVLELEHATKINKMVSLEATVYMFMQLTDYDDTIQTYLQEQYPTLICKQGLLNHMILRSIPHEMAVYLKSLSAEEFNERLINFRKILRSYETMEEKYRDSPMLKGRLVNLIRMIIDMVFNQGYQLPSLDEFLVAFRKVYTMKDSNNILIDYSDAPMFLQTLPWDAYCYISMKIFDLHIARSCPAYETSTSHWANF